MSSTTSAATSNVTDNLHHEQVNPNDDAVNCNSILDSSSNDNITCVDANDSGSIRNTTYFVGNSVSSSDGIAVDSYRGIKYATQDRFAPSEVLLPVGVIDATEYGNECAQTADPPFYNKSLTEDCLYLNIWKPSTSNDGATLPVMMWIFGGGFISGSSSDPLFDGTNLAGNEDIIVVTINYRLAIFGFLPIDEEGTGGMNGILDQINALKWIQHQISFFGGDPNKITIFGESSGAMSVAWVSVIPQANGLFKRAIMESGNMDTPHSAEYGMTIVNKLLNEIDCPTPPCTILDLQNLTTQELLNYTLLFGFVTFDSAVLPADVNTLYKKGAINPTDMIIGANTFDDPALISCDNQTSTDYYIEISNNEGIPASWVWEALPYVTTKKEKQAAVEAYPIDKYNNSFVAVVAQFDGDMMWNCKSRELATLLSSTINGKVYNYYFGYFSDYDYSKTSGLLDAANITDPNWATHEAELPFVWGNPIAIGSTSPSPAFSDKDKSLSKEMMSRWANFAKSGNPTASTGSFSSNEWLPVLGDSSNGKAGADPRYLHFTGEGGTMVESNQMKMKQCASIPLTGVPLTGVNNSDPNSKDNSTSDEL